MDYNTIPRGPQRALSLSSLANRRKVTDFIMLYKILASKLSTNPTDFFDGVLPKSMRGKLKLRVSVAKSRIRCDFLTYRFLKEFNLLLGKYEDLSRLSAHACKLFIAS